MAQQVVVIPPGKGKKLEAFGDAVTVKIDGEASGGSVVIAEVTTGPGGGPPPHIHSREDEMFYVLEGPMDFLINGEWKTAETGTTVFSPKGIAHTFRNSGSKPVRFLLIAQPSGFEIFFAECSEQFAGAGGPDMGKVMEICARHGITMLV